MFSFSSFLLCIIFLGKDLIMEFIVVENNVDYVEAFVPRFSFMLDLVEIVFSKELLRCSFGDILNVGLNK
jgi:hypothetical protein